MTTNDKTRETLRLLTLAVEQNRNCGFNNREHPVVEAAMKEAYATLARTPAQPPVAAVPEKRWPFVESPGEFACRLAEACGEFRSLLPAVRHVLIEHPPTLATPTPAPAAQGESPTRQTDLSKKLRLLYEALGHPHNVFDRRHLLQAADEIERYYGGMLAWKHTAEAKDRQLSELAAPERAEVRPPVLKDHEIAAVVNEATKVAREYGQTQQLRERLCGVLLPACQGTVPGSPSSATHISSRPAISTLVGHG